MFKKLLTTRSVCLSAMIAALYAALTLLLAPISYGAIQCRISEAMTLLPILLPQAIPGLVIGCLVGAPVGVGSVVVMFGVGFLLRFVVWLCGCDAGAGVGEGAVGFGLDRQ